jgi:hypothetical protein
MTHASNVAQSVSFRQALKADTIALWLVQEVTVWACAVQSCSHALIVM